MSDEQPTVLITDDVRTALNGSETLDQLDDSVDNVMLDRRMPRKSGDEVAERIHENGIECMVIFVSAVASEEMPYPDCDEYLETQLTGSPLWWGAGLRPDLRCGRPPGRSDGGRRTM